MDASGMWFAAAVLFAVLAAGMRALSQSPKSRDPGEPLVRERSHLTAWLLASIVESSDDGIYSMDLDSIITSWNKGAEQLRLYGR